MVAVAASTPAALQCVCLNTRANGPRYDPMEIPTMRNKPLGRTGLFVSELCLGTMTFGGSTGIWGQIGDLQQADAERLVGQAL